ncbi:MAG: tRNA pseudouridine(54/55) synthase Pus10 [Zestosphaera sp.]
MLRLGSELLDKAFNALLNYPLCDRCLGRLFARHGLELSNAERGRALKTLIAMSVHKALSSGEEVDSGSLLRLADNGGSPIADVVQRYIGGVNVRKCFICGSNLDSIISELVVKALEALVGREFKSLLVGVEKGSSYEVREGEVTASLNIDSWESIRREVKREVGKRLQLLTGSTPSFRNPDVLLVLNLETLEVRASSAQLFLRGRYVKVGRFISQRWWYLRDGAFRYRASVEGVAERVASLFKCRDVLIHAAGREDVDARMLGDGRPLMIEIVDPLRREVSIEAINNFLRDDWVRVAVHSTASIKELHELKRSRNPKIYRVVIYTPTGLTEKDLKSVEAGLEGVEILQRTPRRILRRKKDVLRRRKVLQTRGRWLSEYLAELVIKCEGGLYVKELVTGDEGRTHPSVSSLLGREVEVLFLDVLEFVGNT